MEKSSKKQPAKKTYWAVFKDKSPLFGGTHTECWDWFAKHFAHYTVSYLSAEGYRIARTS